MPSSSPLAVRGRVARLSFPVETECVSEAAVTDADSQADDE